MSDLHPTFQKIVEAHGAPADMTMAEREMTRRIGELVAERDELRALLLSVVPSLNNIVSEIVDEGDRAYFGSTNDADRLKALAEKLDDWRFDQ